jgi:hypothetical protein
MKHLIIFAIILLGVVLLTLLSYCNKIEEMNSLQLGNCANSSIYLKQSDLGGKYGRGVFANKNYEPGDIIELAPYIEDSNDNFVGVIRDYIFSKNGDRTISIVAFGFASMYNHADYPNVSWKINDSFVIFTCIKPIKKDEELFISYGNQYWKTRENLEKK